MAYPEAVPAIAERTTATKTVFRVDQPGFAVVVMVKKALVRAI